MEQENRSSITYDEDWQKVSESVYPEVVTPEEQYEEPVRKPKRSREGVRHYLTALQLASCIIIAATAFVLKSTGSNLYSDIRKWYYTELNSSVIFDDNNIADLKNLFTASKDEAENT